MVVANIIVDVILAVILLIGFVWGIKSGFINTVAKPVKLVLSIVLAFSCASLVGTGIVQPLIAAPVTNQLSTFLTDKCSEFITTQNIEELPTLIKFAAYLAGINLEELVSDAGQANLVETIVTAIADPFLNLICTVIGFVLAYFAAKILLTIAFAIINSIVDNGVVGVANKILGCIFTTVLAASVVWGLCAISDLILHLPFIYETDFAKEFTGGFIYMFFKNVSPIDLLLSF